MVGIECTREGVKRERRTEEESKSEQEGPIKESMREMVGWRKKKKASKQSKREGAKMIEEQEEEWERNDIQLFPLSLGILPKE